MNLQIGNLSRCLHVTLPNHSFLKIPQWKCSYTAFLYYPCHTAPFIEYIKINAENFHLYLLILKSPNKLSIGS